MNSSLPRTHDTHLRPGRDNYQTSSELDDLSIRNQQQYSSYTPPRRRPVGSSEVARDYGRPDDPIIPASAMLATHVYASSNDPSKNVSEDARSVRTEHTHLERRDLGVLDVAALIINKQIGTGVFTAPGLVLSLTGNKTVAIVLWLVGGVWSLLR